MEEAGWGVGAEAGWRERGVDLGKRKGGGVRGTERGETGWMYCMREQTIFNLKAERMFKSGYKTL